MLGQKEGESSEAMRHLAAGVHTLTIHGRPPDVIVRTVPPLQHAFYHAGDPWDLDHGPLDDWSFLKQQVLPNINVIVSVAARTPLHFEEPTRAGLRWIGDTDHQALYTCEDHLREWKSLGRHWLTTIVNPF